MLLAASLGQRELCRGQGAELVWAQQPEPLKSSPGARDLPPEDRARFEVALQLGAATPASSRRSARCFTAYSAKRSASPTRSATTSTTSREDSGDNAARADPPQHPPRRRPRERAKGDDKDLMEALWSRQATRSSRHRTRSAPSPTSAGRRQVHAPPRNLQGTGRPLPPGSREPNLKGLLRRVLGKIFNDLEIKGWCREFEVKNGVREGEPAEAPVTTPA